MTKTILARLAVIGLVCTINSAFTHQQEVVNIPPPKGYDGIFPSCLSGDGETVLMCAVKQPHHFRQAFL